MPNNDGDAHVALTIFSELEARHLTALLAEVCERRGVLVHEVCGRSRALSVSHARQELWWRIRNLPDRAYSLVEIARLFRRNHATIRHGIAAHRRRRSP